MLAPPPLMRSTAHIKGHPVHPMLIPFPFAYLFGAACIDAWARASNRRDWAQTAKHMRMLGIGSALLAAVPGIIDYFTAVPPKSSAKDRATSHALCNLSALGLFAAADAGSNGSRQPAWVLAAEAAGAALLSAGGWMGGTLVFRNQIAVDHRYADAGDVGAADTAARAAVSRDRRRARGSAAGRSDEAAARRRPPCRPRPD